jgi:hypothetical protein
VTHRRGAVPARAHDREKTDNRRNRFGERMAETDKHQGERVFAKRITKEKLGFSSENLPVAENAYVAWLDLMGAGHMMSTSVHKTANFLVRLHMSVEIARRESGYIVDTLPINDGIFIVGKKKGELMTIVQHTMGLLAARFIATPRPHDRCLMKGGIAYGPVYRGKDLVGGIEKKKMREQSEYLDRVLFGPPVIEAYRSESSAPPYGIAVDASARAFSAPGERRFQMTHWLWWQKHSEALTAKGFGTLPALKDCLWVDLQSHFAWIKSTLILHGLSKDKVEQWQSQAKQYFAAGAP